MLLIKVIRQLFTTVWLRCVKRSECTLGIVICCAELKVNIMNKEQILEKYGNVKLKFNSYWKYTFTFVGVADDGAQVSTSIGGDSGDIYRMDVSADCEETLIGLDAECATIILNGKQIGSYDERW